MDNDFPAAHSMDTVWFAVDQDGHVACFHSHESGAVPVAAFAGDEAYRTQQGLAQVLPQGEAVQELRGRLIPGPLGKEPPHTISASRPYAKGTLMFLRSLDLVQEEIAAGQALTLHCNEGQAVLFRNLPDELFHRLHDTGACLGCFLNFADYYAQAGLVFVDEAAHGLFRYEHLTEEWISGPYGLKERPVRPLLVDQLPPQLRDLAKQMRFDDLCFADTTHIQPVEHGPCESWESAWLDSAGHKVRPIPGKEDEYAHYYHQLLGEQEIEGLEVEPPP